MAKQIETITTVLSATADAVAATVPGTGKGLAAAKRAAHRAKGAATYALTQAQFDAAFDAGRGYAGAYVEAAAALQPLLAPLSGKSSPEAVTQWKHYAEAFRLGMAAEREIDPDSARKAFNRLTDMLGFDKPQTAEARAKAAARAAKRPASPAAEDGGTAMDGAGEAAAAAVQMALSPSEAHLVSLVRQGKHTMAAQFIAELAAQ